MLVLARRMNQSIIIGENIEIVVLDIKGDQVKIGIKAPKNITVYRAEVYQEIQEENKKAITSQISLQDLNKLGSTLKKKGNS